MSFLYPAWFATLIIIPLFILAVIIMRRNRAKIWSAFVSSQHKSELVKQNKPLRFWIAFACSLLGLICLIIAISRPYSGNSVSRDKIQSRNILIAMDTSLSMLCEDVQPNRLSSGVAFAVNLIGALPDDHIGIMAFAGSPNVITSLSIDHPSIIEELGHLGPGSAHIAGSNLKDALYEGINTLKRAGKQANALILITDGTETLDEIDEITGIAKESYVQIFTIGVGTSAGGTIPVNGKPHRDIQRKVVLTKLQDKVLRQLARDTAGVYTHISTQPEKAIADAIQSMTKYEQQGREVQIPRELYRWFLAPGVLFLLASALLTTRFKSSFPALIIAGLFTTLTESHADETSWTDEISTKYLDRPTQIQAGYTALGKKDYSVAIKYLNQAREGTDGDTYAKLSLAIAQAAYRLRDYPLATQEYSQALVTSQPKIQHISQYNLANTLFKQHTAALDVPAEQNLKSYLEDKIRSGTLKDDSLDGMENGLKNALTHYGDLLKSKPQHTSAESNRKATEQVIQTIKEARKTIAEEKKQQQEQQQKEPPKEEAQKKPEPEDKPEDKPGEESKPEGEPNGEGETKGEGKPKPEGEGKGEGKGEGEPKPEGETKNQDDSNAEGDPKPDPAEGESEQSQQETDPKDPENKSANTDKSVKFNNKKEALDFLKKHSDTRKKPLTNRGRFSNRPAVDW